MNTSSCFRFVHKYILIVLLGCFALASTASYAIAQNYDSAKKIVEADKQVRDYQAAKAGGYDFIYNDTSTGETIIKYGFLSAVVAFGLFVLWLKISSHRTGRGKELNEYKSLLISIDNGDQKFVRKPTVTFGEIAIGDLYLYKSDVGYEYICVKVTNEECIFLKSSNNIYHTEFNHSLMVCPIQLK